MNSFFALIFATLLFYMPKSNPHAFYVSVTNIKQVDSEMKMNIKIFSDDLENALTDYNDDISSNPIEQSDVWLRYLNENFKVEINGNESTYRLDKVEIEEDATFTYLILDQSEKVNSINIRNSILFNILEDQTNIIRLEINGKKTFYNFNKKVFSEIINY